MDTQNLKAFVAIHDLGSFSEAAEQLHLTQPAVSKRLAALEDQVGQSLMIRDTRQLQLTDAGRRLLPHARRILDEVHNASLAVKDMDAHIQGQVPVIASHHVGLHHLPAWLRGYVRDYPDVRVSLQFMDSDSAYAALMTRSAELAFVTLSETLPAELEVLIRWNDPMVFVCSPDHPLAKLENPQLADLARYDALLPEAGTATFRAVSRLFLEANLTLSPEMPTNYLETLKVMTGVGLGWSVLPRTMLDPSLVRIRLDHIVDRTLGAVALRDRQLSRPALALVETARTIELPTVEAKHSCR